MTGTYKLELTQDEIFKIKDLIDREDVTKIISRALRDHEMGIPSTLGKTLSEAEASSWLRVKNTAITTCRLCGASFGYNNYRRTNRRKGVKAGTPDHSSPKYVAGVDFETIFQQIVFVSVRDYQSGICISCWDQFKDTFFKGILDHELMIDFGNYEGFESKFELQKTLTCFSCGAESLESEYGNVPALMMGSYPGQCPKCGVQQVPLSMEKHKPGKRLIRK